MRMTKTLCGVSLAAALTLGACGEATEPSAFDSALTFNAAIVAADATLEDLALARAPFAFGPMATPGMGPGGMGPGGMGQPGGHMGIGGTHSGTRSVTFLDAEGHEQAAYDPIATASMHVVLDIGGEAQRTGWSGTVSRTRDMTISGLAGEETTRIFNGTGTEHITRSRTLEDGSAASFDMQGTFTQTNMVVPVPGSEPRYPLSGTVTRTMTVTVVNGPNGDVSRNVNVVITFDGSNTATAMVNGEVHEIDLDARQGAFPLKHRFGKNGG